MMKLLLWVVSLLMMMNATGVGAQAKYPTETQNAALRYWVAFAEMIDPPADKATQNLLEKTAAGEVAWNETGLGPVLDANGDAIQTLQRATLLPECDWGLEYSRGPKASIAYVARARVLARLNTLQAMRELSKGGSQAAVDHLLGGIRFSKHLTNGGSLIFAFVAKSSLLPNLRVLTTAIKENRLSDPQKRQVFAALKAFPDDGFDWSAAWGLEELMLEQLFAELRNATNPGKTYQALIGEAMPSGATFPTPENLKSFKEYIGLVQTALKLPPDAAKTRLLELQTKKRLLHPMLQELTPAPQKANEARSEILATRKALLAALALK